jgi:hypothetical protein
MRFAAHVLRPVALLLALGAAACGGGGDSCEGYITINATPAECARIAEQFGCTSYDVTGPSCGLTACATCEGL